MKNVSIKGYIFMVTNCWKNNLCFILPTKKLQNFCWMSLDYLQLECLGSEWLEKCCKCFRFRVDVDSHCQNSRSFAAASSFSTFPSWLMTCPLRHLINYNFSSLSTWLSKQTQPWNKQAADSQRIRNFAPRIFFSWNWSRIEKGVPAVTSASM